MLPDSVLSTSMPPALTVQVDHAIEQCYQQAAKKEIVLPDQEDLYPLIAPIFACSEFVASACALQPEILVNMLEGALTQSYDEDVYIQRFRAAVAAFADNENALMQAYRRIRREEMVRIAWRDLAGYTETRETLTDLSRLAEAAIESAVDYAHEALVPRYGQPLDQAGNPQQLVVLGMGKLGGGELNYSSDIDLILSYPDSGYTNGRKEIDNGQFFTRVTQRVVKLLNENTADGFVFRVDLRLRPFGDSGPVAMNFDAMEAYYLTQGREWERYAMIKAKVVGGDRTAGETLMSMLKPFVFRRYLDYGAFESLRDLKSKIAAQVARKGMQDNVKLGAGGIREIEFIGQAFQIVRGGREPELQIRSILDVLAFLGQANYLPPEDCDALAMAYDFLRRTENRLQMVDDRQTHDLPTSELGQTRLAYSMGYADWPAFLDALTAHRHFVQQQFEQVFSIDEPSDEKQDELAAFRAVWHEGVERESCCGQLTQLGYKGTENLLNALCQLSSGRLYASLSNVAKERLDKLMPLLIQSATAVDNPDETLIRLLQLVTSVARRSVYLLVLTETPPALRLLTKLFSVSEWIADFVVRYPIVIDELLDTRALFEHVSKEMLEAEAKRLLQRLDADDLESQMDALRHLKQATVMRTAAVDVIGDLPLMKVSDRLTWLGEVALQKASDIAWDQLTKKHGKPTCVVDGERVYPGFAVVAYGKLGGIELGYGSDLDIVFLHNSAGEKQYTNGDKLVDNAVFFARLAQKVVHFIGTLTPAGVLYEIDTRLRPNGASGMLVSAVNAFHDYQMQEAWTWEHQALVRARVVVGNDHLTSAFDRIRTSVLSQQRNALTLRQEVSKMRERMRSELDRSTEDRFHLKQARGGIADIEFMVQYAVLAHSHEYPSLLEYTDNMRLLEQIAEVGLMSPKRTQSLSDAYLYLRECAHRQALTGGDGCIAIDATLKEHTDVVSYLWQRIMELGE